MAFFNPKAAVFFLALFSQVVSINTEFSAKIFYAITAMIIDISWYMVVAWLFSRPLWFRWLSTYARSIEKIFAWILLLLAAKIFFGSL